MKSLFLDQVMNDNLAKNKELFKKAEVVETSKINNLNDALSELLSSSDKLDMLGLSRTSAEVASIAGDFIKIAEKVNKKIASDNLVSVIVSGEK